MVIQHTMSFPFSLLALLLNLAICQGLEKLSPQDSVFCQKTCGKYIDCPSVSEKYHLLLASGFESQNRSRGHRFKALGGHLACSGQFPWTVGLRVKGRDGVLCTGTLISKRHVLTAAHCFHDTYDTMHCGSSETLKRFTTPPMLVIGSLDITTMEPQYLFNYTSLEINDRWEQGKCRKGGDIALLELDRDVPTNIATPICLPKYKRTKYDGIIQSCGWGLVPRISLKDTPDSLYYVELDIQKQFTKCQSGKEKYFLKDLAGKSIEVPNDTIIMKEPADKNVCKGDSGGPLMHLKSATVHTDQVFLIGLTSYGTDCTLMWNALQFGNTEAHAGGVYTDVRHYLDWIYENTNVRMA